MHDFTSFDNFSLVSWLLQYGAYQACYYPSLRRSRVAAEREAASRGLRWWLGRTHYRRWDGRPSPSTDIRLVPGIRPRTLEQAMAARQACHY